MHCKEKRDSTKKNSKKKKKKERGQNRPEKGEQRRKHTRRRGGCKKTTPTPPPPKNLLFVPKTQKEGNRKKNENTLAEKNREKRGTDLKRKQGNETRNFCMGTKREKVPGKERGHEHKTNGKNQRPGRRINKK